MLNGRDHLETVDKPPISTLTTTGSLLQQHLHGELTLLVRSSDLLHIWIRKSENPELSPVIPDVPVSASAVDWLISLQMHMFQTRCPPGVTAGNVAGPSPTGRSILDLHLEPSRGIPALGGDPAGSSARSHRIGAGHLGPSGEGILSGLLIHPGEASVRVKAAEAVRELVMLSPLTSIRLLPLLLNALVINSRRLPEHYGGGPRSNAEAQGNSAAQFALLQVRASC